MQPDRPGSLLRGRRRGRLGRRRRHGPRLRTRDGQIDEDAVDRSTSYADQDGDGFGDGDPVVGCVAEAPTDDDCDDANEDIYPGAPEIADGRDDDCDGATDEGYPTRTPADAWLIAAGPYVASYAGDAVAVGDADGDGAVDLLVGAPFDDRGTVYVVPVPTEGGAVTLGAAATTFTATEYASQVGSSIALPGDVDGDGWPDLVVGASNNDGGSGEWGRGQAWLVLGPVSGALSASDAVLEIAGSRSPEGLGTWCATGDARGDGVPDVLVGGDGDAVLVPLTTRGNVWGPDAPWVGAAGDGDGGTLADVDGDGADDVVVGLIGGVGIDFEPTSGGYDAFLAGSDPGAGLLVGNQAVADVDGDGYLDLAVTDPSTGRALWLPGPIAASGAVADLAGGAVDGPPSAPPRWATFPGDVDGDGTVDLAIQDGSGAVLWLFHATAAGVVSTEDADVVVDGGVTTGGYGELDTLGNQGVVGADLDGDGLSDLVVGSPGTGSVFVLAGSAL